MLPDMADSDSTRTAAAAVALAKRAAKIVITILMSAYKFPEVRWGAEHESPWTWKNSPAARSRSGFWCLQSC